MFQVAVFCGLLSVATAGLSPDEYPLINDLRGFDDSILFDISWTENAIFASVLVAPLATRK